LEKYLHIFLLKALKAGNKMLPMNHNKNMLIWTDGGFADKWLLANTSALIPSCLSVPGSAELQHHRRFENIAGVWDVILYNSMTLLKIKKVKFLTSVVKEASYVEEKRVTLMIANINSITVFWLFCYKQMIQFKVLSFYIRS